MYPNYKKDEKIIKDIVKISRNDVKGVHSLHEGK